MTFRDWSSDVCSSDLATVASTRGRRREMQVIALRMKSPFLSNLHVTVQEFVIYPVKTWMLAVLSRRNLSKSEWSITIMTYDGGVWVSQGECVQNVYNQLTDRMAHELRTPEGPRAYHLALFKASMHNASALLLHPTRQSRGRGTIGRAGQVDPFQARSWLARVCGTWWPIQARLWLEWGGSHWGLKRGSAEQGSAPAGSGDRRKCETPSDNAAGTHCSVLKCGMDTACFRSPTQPRVLR